LVSQLPGLFILSPFTFFVLSTFRVFVITFFDFSVFLQFRASVMILFLAFAMLLLLEKSISASCMPLNSLIADTPAPGIGSSCIPSKSIPIPIPLKFETAQRIFVSTHGLNSIRGISQQDVNFFKQI
jgi:hypothetical protein